MVARRSRKSVNMDICVQTETAAIICKWRQCWLCEQAEVLTVLPHLSADGLCGALFVQHMVTQPSAHTADPSPPAEETLDCALNQPEVSWQHFLSRCVRTCKTLQELGQPSLNTSPHQLLLHSSCDKHKHATGTGKSTKSVFSSLLKHCSSSPQGWQGTAEMVIKPQAGAAAWCHHCHGWVGCSPATTDSTNRATKVHWNPTTGHLAILWWKGQESLKLKCKTTWPSTTP